MVEQDKYLLRTNREVIRLLKSLREKTDFITVRVSGIGDSVMTTVLDVSPKKNLVVLDYGPNEALKQMLAAVLICDSCLSESSCTRP